MECAKCARIASSLTALVAAGAIGVAPAFGQAKTWTVDADFDEGTLINVNHDAPNNDQLQLNFQTEPFPFINVAASARGTIVRIDTRTGQIIGEYRSAPGARGRDPSRTTVDAEGNVWAGNRAEAGGGFGSVVKVGLVIGGTRVNADGTPNPSGQYLMPPFDYNTCVDRDGDGLIKTSNGLGNILAWPDVTDGVGGVTGVVEDAEDECILIYQRVNGANVRHVSVDANDNVWICGYADHDFDLLDGDNGQILASFSVGSGGYGGFVDGNGVIWGSNRAGGLSLLRYDTKNTLTTADDTWMIIPTPEAYGLGLQTNGHVWHSQWANNNILEFAPDGTYLNTYGTGGATNDRGVAVTPVDDNVWVANSGGSDVSRLAANGALLKVIPLGADGVTPTGVAVDADGKVWVTCLSSDTCKRIDPNAGGDGLGAVDLTVNLGAGAGPYNYSDMTGTVLLNAIQEGTWTVVWDSGVPGNEPCAISWTSDEPTGTLVTVEARADDNVLLLPTLPYTTITNGATIGGFSGQYWQIRATLERDPGLTITPVLFDLSIDCNEPPVCPEGVVVVLWPPNHKFHDIVLDELAGVTDPDGDPVILTVTAITQDEPINDLGDGNTSCDGQGVGTGVAQVRAERQGGANGRVYHVEYLAEDGNGGTCEGTILVQVPHDQSGYAAIDDGQAFDSTACAGVMDLNADGAITLDDLLIVISSFGRCGPDETLNWPDGDANQDGCVDITDFNLVYSCMTPPRRAATGTPRTGSQQLTR